MKTISEFPSSVIENIGYYVYLLIDPETDKVFYVGKGTGNRIFAHVNDALTNPDENDKLSMIRSIRTKGFEVKHEILRHGLTEKEAFEIEAALIDFIGLPKLTNLVGGYETTARGRMTIDEINILYGAEPVEILEPALLIIVNKLFERNISEERLYEITRGNWVLGERRNKLSTPLLFIMELFDEFIKFINGFQLPQGVLRKKSRSAGDLKVRLHKSYSIMLGEVLRSISKLGLRIRLNILIVNYWPNAL